MKRAFKVLLVIIVSGLASEGMLRLTGLYNTQSEKGRGSFIDPYQPQHPGWQYHHTPNQILSSVLPEFVFEHRYDSLGYRNDATPDSAEILAFGDSFTEGVGAPQDSTWPALLEAKSGLRVYNAGVMGSDPAYYLMALKQRFTRLHPRAVLVLLNYSDVYDVMMRGGMERFDTDSSVHYKTAPWYMPLYRYSHCFRAFLHIVLQYDFMFNSPANREKNTDQALETIALILKEMNEHCTAHGISFKVFIHPIPGEYYKQLDSRTDFKKIDLLTDKLNQCGVSYMSLRDEMEARLPSAEDWKAVSWPLDGHFNRLGYETVADIMVNDSFFSKQ